jgi:hypothetical protein
MALFTDQQKAADDDKILVGLLPSEVFFLFLFNHKLGVVRALLGDIMG